MKVLVVPMPAIEKFPEYELEIVVISFEEITSESITISLLLDEVNSVFIGMNL